MLMELSLRKIELAIFEYCVINAKFPVNPKFACHEMPPIK